MIDGALKPKSQFLSPRDKAILSSMSTKNIAVSTLWQIASQGAMAVLSAASVKFVALGLSKELAGSYNSAYGYLQLFAILADFGLYAVSVREVSRTQEKERVLGSLLVLRVIIMTIALGSGLMIAWLVPSWSGTQLRIGITIAALVPFFTLLAGVLRTVFQIHFAMHFVFIAEVTQRVVTVGLMALIILAGVRMSSDHFVYQQFLWVGAVSAFVLFVLSTIFAYRLMPVRPVFDPTLLKKLFFQAAPYGAAFLCIALYRQFDLTLIALLREDFAIQNAEYGFAQRISEMTFLVPTFLLNSTLPILSERHAKGEPTDVLLGRTFLAILMICSIASLFAFFWARPLMQLLTTDAYLSNVDGPGSDTALKLLSIPMFLNGIVLYSFYTLLTEHRWKPLVGTMALGVLLSLSLNIFLIPRLGFVGAISSSTMVHLFLALALFPQAQRALPALLHTKHLFLLILGTVVFGAWILFLAPFLTSNFTTVLGALVALLPLAFGFGIFWRMKKA